MDEKTIITRSPVEGESNDEALLLHRERCDMAPNGKDIVVAARQRLVSRWNFGTVESDRARRAGAQVRIQEVEKLSLNQWKRAIHALYAVTYGTIGQQIVKLIEICFYSKSRGEASTACAAFEAAGPNLGFVDSLVFDWVSEILFVWPNSREVTLKKAAGLCGLIAENGEYEYEARDSASHSGYRRLGDKVDFGAALARGVATFEVSSLPILLEYWERLAHQSGKPVPLPKNLNWDSVKKWAHCVLDAAAEEEGTNSPDAWVEEAEEAESFEFEGDLHLIWWGTYTQHRNLRISVFFEPEGEVSDIVTTIRWDSATGSPSRFLGIQDLLALPGCLGFSPVDGPGAV